jgi:hypothetical protein
MDSVKPLDYACKPPVAERLLRRGYRWVLLAAGLAALILWAPGAWRWAQFFYWRHRCLAFALPPDHVMYEIAGGKVLHTEAALAEIRFDHLSASHVYVATIFLHEMRRPGGAPCLVSLDLAYVPPTTPGPRYVLHLRDEQWNVSGLPRPPHWQDVLFPEIDDQHHWKFFAGQSDPQDPSHLTFDYVMDGQRHTCDGWLTEDGRLIVSRRP